MRREPVDEEDRKKLASKWRQAIRSIDDNDCDKSLYYDTQGLVSFPKGNTILLKDNKIELIDVRITVPSDFPDELVNHHVSIRLDSGVLGVRSLKPLPIGCQNVSRLAVIVVT